MDDLAVRAWIYEGFATTGLPPSARDLAMRLDDPDAASATLRRLHDRHMVVLDADGEIAMALPFAARPTGHRVVSGERSWWANCAWDSLAIPAAVGVDAVIEARFVDTDEPVDLGVRGGELVGADAGALVHFAVPARHWWDDIVET